MDMTHLRKGCNVLVASHDGLGCEKQGKMVMIQARCLCTGWMKALSDLLMQ